MAKDVDNNELADFISETLKAVGRGITSSGVSQKYGPMGAEAFRMPKEVNFDIALTVKHSNEASGGFKIQVFGAGVGVAAKDGGQSETVSRVQFSVPWDYENAFARLVGPPSAQPPVDRYDELNDD